MSQYGAYGMALDGYSWQEIVTHYFTDTEVAEIDPMFVEAPLWVGITQEETRVNFLVRSIGAAVANLRMGLYIMQTGKYGLW